MALKILHLLQCCRFDKRTMNAKNVHNIFKISKYTNYSLMQGNVYLSINIAQKIESMSFLLMILPCS